MYLVKSIEQYNPQHVFYCDPIKNNVMNDSNFIRIIYSTPEVSLNGVYLLIHLQDITCEPYFSKYKCSFSLPMHRDLVEQLRLIEEDLLSKYVTSKIACPKIHEQLRMGHIKLFSEVEHRGKCSFILKISGIWETYTSYGLTYKFIQTC